MNGEDITLDEPPVLRLEDVEEGVFQMVVTYYKLLEKAHTKEIAMERVAEYLESLAKAFRNNREESNV